MLTSGVSHSATLRVRGVLSVLSFLLLAGPAFAVVVGDVDNSGTVDAIDVQLVINGALGIPVGVDTDIDRNGATNAVDVQLVINGALGLRIDTCTVPDVIGMVQLSALSAITRAGLVVGTVLQAHSDTEPSGNVISQSPPPGASAIPGTSVDLVISEGPAPPTIQSFFINSDAVETTTRTVTLNNSCTGNPTEYAASESANFSGAMWLVYSNAPLFVLSTGNGAKAVYFKVKNAAGESAVVSDMIDLKEPPAVTSFSINNGAASTASATVALNNSCTGDPTHYMASEAPDFGGASWQTYAVAPDFVLSSGNGIKTVYFKVKSATNESVAVLDTITLSEPPTITSFEINNGALSTATRTVTLNNTCVGSPTHYMASEDPDFSGTPWQAYSSAPDFKLSSGDGTKIVYFKAKNPAGESVVASASIALQELPTVTVFSIDNGATTTLSTRVTLENVCTANPTHYTASEFSDFSGSAWQVYSSAPSFKLSPGIGMKTVYIKVRNATGESAAVSDTITLNEPTPGMEDTILLPDNVPLMMVWIPRGTFLMGRWTGEQNSAPDEDPQHEVTFAEGFWMSKYEVTQAQWRAVMGNNPSYFQGANAGYVNTDNRPVDQVSWDAIAAPGGFLEEVNASNPGMGFRLPSEAEWEYAYRAGTTTRFYWDNDPSYGQIGTYAWYISNSDSQTHDVGGKQANAWGLYDMSGNILEWVQDWYHDRYAGAPSDGSAWESPAGLLRVLRGGGWYYNNSGCRAAYRVSNLPSNAGKVNGFRLCRSF